MLISSNISANLRRTLDFSSTAFYSTNFFEFLNFVVYFSARGLFAIHGQVVLIYSAITVAREPDCRWWWGGVD